VAHEGAMQRQKIPLCGNQIPYSDFSTQHGGWRSGPLPSSLLTRRRRHR
jgi:hypothetical protein